MALLDARDNRLPVLQLPGQANSVPVARRAVAATLQAIAGVSEDQLLAARLIVSELVANAVVHAGSAVTVSWAVVANRLRIEVCDDSVVVPVAVKADAVAERGRGLSIVDSMASRWGIERVGGRGKAVWAEIDLRA